MGVTLVLFGALCATTPGFVLDTRSDLQRAYELEKGGEYQQAIPVYLEILRREPENLAANLGLGRVYYDSSQYSEAAERFGRALQLQPSNARIVEWLGKSYLGAGEPPKVVELLTREDTLVGQYAWAHLLLARAFDAQDKLDEARGELQRALSLDPRCLGAHFALGFIAWTTRDLETAEKELRRELALDPRQELAYFYLAETLEVQGKLDAAQAVLEQMGHQASNTYLYHLGLGKLKEYRRDFDTAVVEFREAIRLDSQQSEAHYHLGMALRKTGQSAQASREFELANQLRSSMPPGAGQAMGRMRPRLPSLD